MKEIEARFLEIDTENVKKRLRELGAEDLEETLLEEVIFYDKDLIWRDVERKLVRLRKIRDKVMLTYKQHHGHAIDSAEEIEFEIDGLEQGIAFCRGIGLREYRHQEKKRHTFVVEDVSVDIDTWPNIPTYLEIEGPSEARIKEVALSLGFDWSTVVFKSPGLILKEYYNTPVTDFTLYTFDRIE